MVPFIIKVMPCDCWNQALSYVLSLRLSFLCNYLYICAWSKARWLATLVRRCTQCLLYPLSFSLWFSLLLYLFMSKTVTQSDTWWPLRSEDTPSVYFVPCVAFVFCLCLCNSLKERQNVGLPLCQMIHPVFILSYVLSIAFVIFFVIVFVVVFVYVKDT